VPIRAEREEDKAVIRAVNSFAFKTLAESDLVDALREQAWPIVSLAADVGCVHGPGAGTWVLATRYRQSQVPRSIQRRVSESAGHRHDPAFR
jgi:hypothetical protein